MLENPPSSTAPGAAPDTSCRGALSSPRSGSDDEVLARLFERGGDFETFQAVLAAGATSSEALEALDLGIPQDTYLAVREVPVSHAEVLEVWRAAGPQADPVLLLTYANARVVGVPHGELVVAIEVGFPLATYTLVRTDCAGTPVELLALYRAGLSAATSIWELALPAYRAALARGIAPGVAADLVAGLAARWPGSSADLTEVVVSVARPAEPAAGHTSHSRDLRPHVARTSPEAARPLTEGRTDKANVATLRAAPEPPRDEKVVSP